MPLKFDLEGALAEPASGLKFDIESALSPSVGRTPPQDQPLESDLAGIVQPRQELRQKPIGERIAGMRPAPAEIRNSPSTIYKADNPVLNAALGVPRAFVHGAEQAIQAGAGFTGNEQARKASERRVQGLMLESDFPDLEQGAGSMLAIAPAALINPAFGAAVGGGLAAGPAIGEGMEAGLSTPEAIAYGVGQGGLEYLTERIPIGILFGKGGAHVAERLVKAFFPEATGEQIATLTQDALRQSVIEPNKPWSEYWAERGEAAKRTLIATAGGLGAAGAIQAGVQRLVPQTNQFADVLDEVVRGTTIKPAGLDIVQDLYDRGRTRFANVPVQPQPELNVPSSASTLAQQPIQAAPLTAQGQATMPDEYAGPGGYAIPQGEADAIQEQIPAEVDVREQARDGEEVAIGDAEVQAPAEEGRPQEVAFDVSGRTDEQLAWLAEHGKPGWREAAIAEGERRGIAPVEQEAAPPADESSYLVRAEVDKAFGDQYANADSRTTPSAVKNPPVGSWILDEHRGMHGREIEQIVEIPVDNIEVSEDTGPQKWPDVERYAGWILDGKEMPAIRVLQTDAGTLKTLDHRRLMAAKAVGKKTILARVSRSGMDGNVATGYTFEMAQRGITPMPIKPARPDRLLFPDDAKALGRIRQKFGASAAKSIQHPPVHPKRTARPSNNLIRRIHQLGGINLRYLPDVAGERKVQRGMPVGLFRKNGMGLDDLSRMLADEGFPINVEDPTDIDGVRQLTELLQKTLSGGTVLNYSGQQAMLDAMAKAEAEIDMPEQAALDDPEAIAEREAIKQADIAIQGVTNDELDALLDAAFNDERTPNAILSDEEIDQLFASASDAPQTQPEGQDADSVAGSPEAESFALDAYTPEDLKQREVQPEPERPEAPSPADFVLSGSNRQADEAEARGQRELAPAEPARPVTISKDVIPAALATAAFNGTSHTPERRGESARQDYVNTLEALWGKFEAQYNAANDDIKAAFVEAFNDIANKYGALYRNYLASHARVVSAFIAGPSNFPAARMNKRSESADKRANEANEYIQKAQAKLMKVLRGKVDNSVQSALVEAKEKLAQREAAQEKMKQANAALRKGDDAALEALGYTAAQIAQLKKPDYAGRIGFADYALKNNNAEIRRMRARVQELEGRIQESEAAPEEQAGPVRIVRNIEEGRLQLFFDGKPDESTRNALKARGFRWSPNNGAWQRQLTDSAVVAAEQIVASMSPAQEPGSSYTVSEPTTDEYTHDLFGNPLPDKPRARGSRAQQQAAQTRNVDTASSVPPGQYGTTTKLITHATREIGATNVSTVDEAATALSYLGRGAVERFDALVTDKNGKPLALVGSFKGALTQTSVFPSTVIAEAFRIPGAANIWFAHNHPSGTPELSQADRWLTSQLENVFEGTGINTHGTFAITNDGRYTHTDGGRGTIKPAKSTMRLDAVEREFDKFDKLGAAFSDPAAAQTEMRVMGLKDPGLVLLDTQNAPIAFIPMGGMEAMPLKHNGRLDALYRAISYANAGAAVIYDPRGDFTEAQYRNIGAALGQVDVKLLDVFQKGVSMAEKGRPLVASTLLSRGPNAAGMSVESATSLLRKRFGKRIDKMLEAGTLKIVATPAELPAWGKGQRGIGGAWDGTTAWIVASQASPETLAATYLHEVGEHAGMQEMLGDKYQDIITRLDDLIWDGDATANRAASRVPKDTPAKDEQHERLAYFIEEAQRARDSQPQTLSTKARQLLQDILAAIRAWAYRQFGGITLTEADILALARQSAKRVADQASEKLDAMREAEVQMSRTDTITVDGVDRPTTNSNGQRIAQTEEGLRNFWRWFGDSKVVDNEGRPLVVYHGTGADFSEFKELSFFSPRTDVADIYAMAPTRQIDGGGANTMPVYLAIGIPFVFDSAVASDSLSRTVLGKRGKLAKVLEELEKQGFDGIVLENFDDLGGPQLQYVAFSPTQIKSATGNRGTFDPASPDIRFSKEPQSTDAEEMAKKFGFAIKGMADARIQPSAERAYIENQEMFERMKRGVVSNADSKKAGEALAAEVGWSPDSVDAFMKEAAQKGTPPVDILAAMFAMSRMQSIKLLEAQNPTQFIEYTMDVLRTLMATRAYGSEMGRALQFIGAMERMGGYTAADVTSEGGSLPRGQIAPPTPSQIAEQKTKAKQTAQKAKDILAKDPKLSDLVSEEAMTKALGGDNGIRKIMAAMHKQGKDVDLGMLVSYLSGMVDSIAKEQSENRSTLNKLMAMHVELWRANILTGLFTHEVNVTSNAANMLIEFGLVNPIQEMLPGGIGLGGYLDALKAMGGYRKVLADIWALMKYNAFEEAPASRLSHLLDQRDPELLALMRGTEGSKWADTHRKFIPGLAGKVVRGAGFVPLGIEDAIFKVIPFRYELARQQAAGEQRNVTAAIDAANKLTFQDGTGMLGMVVAKMHEKAPYSEFWITFVKTMTNLIKRSFDLTPGLSQAKNWDALIGKEGDKARREAIALSIVGVGIASMVMALMGDDDDEVQLSGFAPYDRLKKLLWLEEHDNIGLRIGDEVYPFYRMSPLAEPAGLTLGAYNSIKQGEAGPLFNAMYQSIVTKHFMAKIADLIDGIEEVARAEGNEKSEAGERLVRRQLGGIATGTLIPNFIAQLGDMTDAEKREVNTIMQDLQKKIPGLRESLPSKLKVTGEVLGEPRYMSPFPVQGKPVKKDEVTRWLLKLGRGIDPNPKSIKDLPHDVRQTLLRERWEFLGYAYEASKDLDAETQEKIIRKMLSAWTENAKAARVMHELETPAD